MEEDFILHLCCLRRRRRLHRRRLHRRRLHRRRLQRRVYVVICVVVTYVVVEKTSFDCRRINTLKRAEQLIRSEPQIFSSR